MKPIQKLPPSYRFADIENKYGETERVYFPVDYTTTTVTRPSKLEQLIHELKYRKESAQVRIRMGSIMMASFLDIFHYYKPRPWYKVYNVVKRVIVGSKV